MKIPLHENSSDESDIKLSLIPTEKNIEKIDKRKIVNDKKLVHMEKMRTLRNFNQKKKFDNNLNDMKAEIRAEILEDLKKLKIEKQNKKIILKNSDEEIEIKKKVPKKKVEESSEDEELEPDRKPKQKKKSKKKVIVSSESSESEEEKYIYKSKKKPAYDLTNW